MEIETRLGGGRFYVRGKNNNWASERKECDPKTGWSTCKFYLRKTNYSLHRNFKKFEKWLFCLERKTRVLFRRSDTQNWNHRFVKAIPQTHRAGKCTLAQYHLPFIHGERVLCGNGVYVCGCMRQRIGGEEHRVLCMCISVWRIRIVMCAVCARWIWNCWLQPLAGIPLLLSASHFSEHVCSDACDVTLHLCCVTSCFFFLEWRDDSGEDILYQERCCAYRFNGYSK